MAALTLVGPPLAWKITEAGGGPLNNSPGNVLIETRSGADMEAICSIIKQGLGELCVFERGPSNLSTSQNAKDMFLRVSLGSHNQGKNAAHIVIFLQTIKQDVSLHKPDVAPAIKFVAVPHSPLPDVAHAIQLGAVQTSSQAAVPKPAPSRK